VSSCEAGKSILLDDVSSLGVSDNMSQKTVLICYLSATMFIHHDVEAERMISPVCPEQVDWFSTSLSSVVVRMTVSSLGIFFADCKGQKSMEVSQDGSLAWIKRWRVIEARLSESRLKPLRSLRGRCKLTSP
jgi:hypothetical protein